MKQGIINQQNLVFIEAAWYNTVGFVLAQDAHTREYKCYTHKLGGDDNGKYTKDQDINKILGHGSYFPLEAAKAIFAYDTNKDFIYENPELYL